MTSQRRLKIALICVLVLVGCVCAFYGYDLYHVRHAEVFEKTGLCTEIVQYENKFSTKHRGKSYYQVLQFDDGTEFVCGESVEEFLPHKLTVGYVQTFWLGANGPTVVSIRDGDVVYLSYEDWLAERITQDWECAVEFSVGIVLIVLLASSYDIYKMICQARRDCRKKKKKADRQRQLAEKRMKENEVSK